ncbi:MAG: hypothetical protein FWC01_00470 [Treponema sp.]|nr:hypothetical protein [Treponema sp.]MCL2237369.1 hypothetical protein [Treponema sp.]
MKFRSTFVFLLILPFFLQNLFAMETGDESSESSSLPSGISAIELEAGLGAEYNRSNFNNGSIMLIAGIEFIDMILIRGGISYIQSTLSTDLNSFVNARFSPFSRQYLSPLSFAASYIYNGMIDLDIHTHSILPMVSYMTDVAGASVGLSLRFTSFFGENPQFETVLSFYAYFNFIRTETFVLGLGAGTMNDFNARNMAAIWLNLNADFRLNKNFSIHNEIEIMQSGMDGLTATFYGFAWRGGVKYSW